MISSNYPGVFVLPVGFIMKLTVVILAAILATSCNPCVVRGTVVDMKGEPIPGVSVSLDAGEPHALTDELGRYALSISPGRVPLHFIKSGYTAGHLVLDVAEPRGVAANPVSLWCLPANTGAYLVENWKYVRMTASEPKPYTSTEKGLIYGIARLPETPRTTLQSPVVILYNLPSFDIKVCRLRQVEAALLDSPGERQTVWAQEMVIGTRLRPVDEPERTLWEASLIDPLEPGVYAIHWGALQGQAENELRAFLFSVYDPAKPAESESQEQALPEKKHKSEAEREPGPETEEADAEASSDPDEGTGF